MARTEEPAAGAETVHVNDEAVRRASIIDPDFETLQANSKAATEFESELSFGQAFKLYKKGVIWSILMSTALVMEGYDLVIINGFYALPQFLDKYGTDTLPDGSKTVSAAWRAGLNNGVLIGEILGLMVTGIIQDRYGYKKTIGGALACLIGFIFIGFFSQSIEQLIVGEILCGLCWGVFQTITTAYASEVTPVAIRAYLTTYVNLCWVFGQLVGNGVLRGLLDRPDQWAYRIPFAIQWVWPVPLLVACIFCPESPWWLVRHGRIEEAKRSLKRLTSTGVDSRFDVDKTIAMIKYTDNIEKQLVAGTSYLDCFRGVNLRRTEIVSFTWLTQVFCGSYFTGYSTVFFEQAGLDPTNAFSLAIGESAIGAVGTIGAWFLMSRAGRRTIYLWGALSMALVMFTIGFTGIPKTSDAAHWASGSLLVVFVLIYDFTVGPVCYSLVAELPSTRLKAKSIVLARNVYNIGGIVANVLINYQLTPTAWNWGPYCGFFWGGTCFMCATWIYFRLPEPKGRTYGELDVLFENKVSARVFHKTNVDITSHVLDREDAPSLSEKGEKSRTSHVEHAELTV